MTMRVVVRKSTAAKRLVIAISIDSVGVPLGFASIDIQMPLTESK